MEWIQIEFHLNGIELNGFECITELKQVELNAVHNSLENKIWINITNISRNVSINQSMSKPCLL